MSAASKRIATDPNAAYQFAATTHSAEGNAAAIQIAKGLEAQGNHEAAANLMVAKAQQALQAGQGNQIYSMWDKLSPETIAQTAAKTIEKYNATAKSPVPQLTAEQYKGFVDQAKNIQSLPEGRAKGMATQNLLKSIGQLVPSSGTDKAFALYRTGLLTGFRTPGKVLVSHAGQSILEQAKNLPAKVADTAIGAARAPFIGKFQRGLSVTPKGQLTGGVKGFGAAVDNLVHGYNAAGSGGAQADFTNHVNFGNSVGGKIAQQYVDKIGQLHGSLYKPFYGAQHLNSLYDMATTNAKNQGLHGTAKSAFVHDFVSKATDASIKDQSAVPHADFTTPEGAAQRANAEANYTTFQNPTALSAAAAGLKKGLPGSRYGLPFTQIPSSIAMKIVDYSPVGPIKEAIQQVHAGTFDQRALSQAIGRGATGTGIMALGTELAKKGLMSGGYPTDTKTRAQWALQGKTANSVLVGGKWRALSSLGPAGDALGVGAAYQAGLQGNKKTPGNLTNAAIAGSVGGLSVLANSPYLQTLENTTAALQTPGTKANKLAEGLAGSVIPTGIANIATATDKNARQTNSPKDAVTNKIPRLRENNLPQVDVLGNNVPRPQGPLGTLLDPFYSSTAHTTPVATELNRLNNTYNPATPAPITKNQSINGQKVSLNHQQLTQLQQQSGQPLNLGLNSLIKTPSYQQAPDQAKANVINSVTTAVRQSIRNTGTANLQSILQNAQTSLDKTAFKSSGQSVGTINGRTYHLTPSGKVSTAAVKKTSVKTPTIKTSKATKTGSRSTAKTKIPNFKIASSKLTAPKVGKISIKGGSSKAPKFKTPKATVAKIPGLKIPKVTNKTPKVARAKVAIPKKIA